jgi:hypothetical protein
VCVAELVFDSAAKSLNNIEIKKVSGLWRTVQYTPPEKKGERKFAFFYTFKCLPVFERRLRQLARLGCWQFSDGFPFCICRFNSNPFNRIG